MPTLVEGSLDAIEVLLIWGLNFGLGLDSDEDSITREGSEVWGSLIPCGKGGGAERLLKQFLHIHED